MRSLPRPLVAAAVAAALLTAGGGDDPEVGSLPALTPTPTPTASATPAGLTAADLERVAREYYAALGKAFQTNDFSLFQAVATPSCGCYASVQKAIARQESRGVTSTAMATVQRVLDPKVEGPDAGRVSVVFEERPSTLVDASGAVVERVQGSPPIQQVLTVQRVDGRLLVTGVQGLGPVG